MRGHRKERGLGWLGVALGLAEVAATKLMTKAIRVNHRPALVRMLGLRRITTRAGILSKRRQAPWVWARVAGDVMDLATLSSAIIKKKGNRGRLAAALAAVAGVTALDVLCGRRMRTH